jgi:hypothetical protein
MTRRQFKKNRSSMWLVIVHPSNAKEFRKAKKMNRLFHAYGDQGIKEWMEFTGKFKYIKGGITKAEGEE